MSAPGSRLARQMLSHLGTELWDEFVSGACESALQGGLAARVRARIVRCGGTLDGAPCAHATLVDLRAGAGTGVEISARSARRSSNCTWTTSGRCCDVPLLARGNTGGAAVSWNDELDCRGYVVLQLVDHAYSVTVRSRDAAECWLPRGLDRERVYVC